MKLIDCDFIPAAFHEKQALRRAVKLRTFFVCMMYAFMMLWGVVHRHRLSNAQAMLTEVSHQQGQLDVHAEKKEAMEFEQNRLRDRQRLLDQLSDRSSLVVVLSALSRHLPETVILTEWSLQRPSLSSSVDVSSPRTATGPRGPRSRQRPSDDADTDRSRRNAILQLTGIAVSIPDVIQFAAALESSPLFDRVYMEARGPTVWAGRRAEKFDLNCELVPQDRESR